MGCDVVVLLSYQCCLTSFSMAHSVIVFLSFRIFILYFDGMLPYRRALNNILLAWMVANVTATYQCCLLPPMSHPTEQQKEARKSPFKISPQQRKQQHIFSELGQVIPKVLTTRAFPDDFKVRPETRYQISPTIVWPISMYTWFINPCFPH